MTQSIKYTAAMELQQSFQNAVQSAISWVEKLNQEITNIGVVTGKTAMEMERVYDGVINKSNELRVAAADYAKAATIFYQ